MRSAHNIAFARNRSVTGGNEKKCNLRQWKKKMKMKNGRLNKKNQNQCFISFTLVSVGSPPPWGDLLPQLFSHYFLKRKNLRCLSLYNRPTRLQKRCIIIISNVTQLWMHNPNIYELACLSGWQSKKAKKPLTAISHYSLTYTARWVSLSPRCICNENGLVIKQPCRSVKSFADIASQNFRWGLKEQNSKSKSKGKR